MKRTIIAALCASLLLTLMNSCDVWGTRTNAVDSGSTSYQGYPSVSSADAISIVSPSDGGTLTGITVTVAKVVGAKAYEIRLASSAASVDSSPLFSKADYTSNVLDLSTASILGSTTYYWKARALASSGSWGSWTSVASFTTSFTAAATPTFSPVAGTYTASQSVSISCSTSGATIYYTTDGSEPSSSSNVYSSAISVTNVSGSNSGTRTTIKAIALAPGYLGSSTASAAYLIGMTSFALGDTGPGGGLIFYDKGSYSGSPAWRYLEAAPSDQDTMVPWDPSLTGVVSTGTAIGDGKANTAAIVAAKGSGYYAASVCANATVGGLSDWFLPSKAELALLYTNLYTAGLGSFSPTGGQGGLGGYWSSSQNGYNYAWAQLFHDGSVTSYVTSTTLTIRAIRSF